MFANRIYTLTKTHRAFYNRDRVKKIVEEMVAEVAPLKFPCTVDEFLTFYEKYCIAYTPEIAEEYIPFESFNNQTIDNARKSSYNPYEEVQEIDMGAEAPRFRAVKVDIVNRIMQAREANGIKRKS